MGPIPFPSIIITQCLLADRPELLRLHREHGGLTPPFDDTTLDACTQLLLAVHTLELPTDSLQLLELYEWFSDLEAHASVTGSGVLRAQFPPAPPAPTSSPAATLQRNTRARGSTPEYSMWSDETRLSPTLSTLSDAALDRDHGETEFEAINYPSETNGRNGSIGPRGFSPLFPCDSSDTSASSKTAHSAHNANPASPGASPLFPVLDSLDSIPDESLRTALTVFAGAVLAQQRADAAAFQQAMMTAVTTAVAAAVHDAKAEIVADVRYHLALERERRAALDCLNGMSSESSYAATGGSNPRPSPWPALSPSATPARAYPSVSTPSHHASDTLSPLLAAVTAQLLTMGSRSDSLSSGDNRGVQSVLPPRPGAPVPPSSASDGEADEGSVDTDSDPRSPAARRARRGKYRTHPDGRGVFARDYGVA